MTAAAIFTNAQQPPVAQDTSGPAKATGQTGESLAGSKSQEEELYQEWLRNNSGDLFLQYFRQFPQGIHRDAMVNDLCQKWDFKKVDGAPLLVRFMGYHTGSKTTVQDGNKYDLELKPVMKEVSAEQGKAFVTVAIQFLALRDASVDPAKDVRFAIKGNTKDTYSPIRFNVVGMVAMPMAIMQMNLEKMPYVVMEGVWETKLEEAQNPVISIFASPFDLKALKVKEVQ